MKQSKNLNRVMELETIQKNGTRLKSRMRKNKSYRTNIYLFVIACVLLVCSGNLYAQSDSTQQSGHGYGFLIVLGIVIVLLFGQKILKWIVEAFPDIKDIFSKSNKEDKDKWI